MKCNACGAELANNATVCDACGASVTPIEEALEGEVLTNVPQKNPGKTLGIASFILALSSVVLPILLDSCCTCASLFLPFLVFGAIIPGLIRSIGPVVGLILGIIGLKKSKAAGYKNGLALAGVIISAILIGLTVLGIIIGVVLAILYFAFGIGAGLLVGLEEMMYELGMY